MAWFKKKKDAFIRLCSLKVESMREGFNEYSTYFMAAMKSQSVRKDKAKIPFVCNANMITDVNDK